MKSYTLFDMDTYLGGVKHAERLFQKGYTVVQLESAYYRDLHMNGNVMDDWLKGYDNYISHVQRLKNLKLI